MVRLDDLVEIDFLKGFVEEKTFQLIFKNKKGLPSRWT